MTAPNEEVKPGEGAQIGTATPTEPAPAPDTQEEKPADEAKTE